MTSKKALFKTLFEGKIVLSPLEMEASVRIITV